MIASSSNYPIFRSIALVGKHNESHIHDLLNRVGDFLESRQCVVQKAVFQLDKMNHGLSQSFLSQPYDLMIALGGDGTFLSAARLFFHQKIPLLGINLGRLGFLTDISFAQFEIQLGAILRGEFTQEKRLLLQGELETKATQISAFNDIVIYQSDVARMIELDVWVDDNYLTTYRANGLIFATPTGSTAYALSTGGPLIYPTIPTILIAPICPHTLSHRPIVVPANSTIRVLSKHAKDPHVKVSFDGQEHIELPFSQALIIQQHAVNANLIHPLEYDYFRTLRSKLNWGMSPVHNR